MRDNDELIAFTELGSEIDLRFYGVAFVLRPDGSTARELGNPKRAVNLRSILKLVRGPCRAREARRRAGGPAGWHPCLAARR